MNGFSFPPPPPPPPKATSSSTQQDQPTQFNSRGRGGRGGRGNRGSFRGRGNGSQRGGGNFYRQNSTNHAGYGQDTGNYQSNYGNQQQQYQAPQQQQYQQYQQYQHSQQYQAPPGSYVNPAFTGVQAQVYPQAQSSQYGQQTPHAVGQAISFQRGDTGNADFSPGSKRTRDQAFGHSNRGHPMKKTSSVPKIQVAPAIPSFGAPILPQRPPAPLDQSGGLRQRTSTGLGLLPKTYNSPENSEDDDEEEEEEEDVDEEASLSALQSGPLSFEFNGELATLSSAAEIAEWIEERKKRWPSKRRIEEKEQEVFGRMEERRRIEQETRAAIASASGGEYLPIERREDRVPRKPATEDQAQKNKQTLEDTQKELAMQMQKVEELQKLLAAKGQTQNLEAADTTDAAVDTTQPTTTDGIVTDHPHANTQDQDPPAEHADSYHSDSDSDAPPEESSSKLSQPLRVPPPSQPTKAQAKTQPTEPKQCISFLSQGRCKFGNKCRYRHDASSGQEKGKRKTLYQRLVEQEMEEENKLALQAIKYLGSVGFFSKHAAST